MTAKYFFARASGLVLDIIFTASTTYTRFPSPKQQHQSCRQALHYSYTTISKAQVTFILFATSLLDKP